MMKYFLLHLQSSDNDQLVAPFRYNGYADGKYQYSMKFFFGEYSNSPGKSMYWNNAS